MKSPHDELAALRIELDQLRLNMADEVNARVATILAAKEIAPGATFSDCQTLAEIRARAVSHVHGLAEIEGESADCIAGMFAVMSAIVVRDPVRLALIKQGERRH